MIALMNLFKRSSGLIMVRDLARSCSPDLDVSIGRCYCATALASLTEIERRHLDAGPCAKRMRFSNVPNTPAIQLRRLRQGHDSFALWSHILGKVASAGSPDGRAENA